VSTAETTPFEEVMAAGGEWIQASMDGVERQLAVTTSAYGPELARFAGNTLAAGGKRLRPMLVFICGEVCAETLMGRSRLVRAGASVELVHMASLVHDDVVDSAMVRRGRPTVYAASGRRPAIATGDFLFSQAFSLLRANDDQGQIRTLSDACLALARGELAQREDAYSRSIDVERYIYRCGLKTASLFTAACKLGALAARRTEDETEALARFGHKVGLAFQMLDDVLDVVGPAERTGKERGSDLLEGTTTLPLILAAAEDPELAELDLRSIDSREQAEQVCDRLAATDALDEARGRANELVSAAKTELDGRLDPDAVEMLRLVADRVVSRLS
jgi:geranylgeranyl pyrophosphate synthase